jgi:RNA polymerase sigma factor (sigma-70 family)
MEICATTLEKLRLKLGFKVRYHLGSYCPDVEDVVQETISRVIDAAQNNRIRNPDSLSAFASATCSNVIREYRRGIWRDAPLDFGDSVRDPAASAAQTAEVHDLVARTLASLPDRDRMLLYAFYIQEKPVEEIIAEWGLTEAAFRVALFRARERFRKIAENGLKSQASEQH